MGIQCACPDCGEQYTVKDAFAGKKLRCKCGASIRVPQSVASSLETAGGSGDFSSFADLERSSQRVVGQFQPMPAPPRQRVAQIQAPQYAPPPQPAPMDAPAWPTTSARRKSPGSDPYVTLPGEDGIDTIVPLVGILGFLIVIIIRAVKTYQFTSEYEYAAAEAWWKLVQAAVIPFVIGGPLALLGVFVAGKIMKFPLPRNAYIKMMAVFCWPGIFVGLAQTYATTQSQAILVGMILPPPVGLATMWLLYRLKPLRFLVAVVFAAVFVVVGIAILALVVGSLIYIAGSAEREPKRPKIRRQRGYVLIHSPAPCRLPQLASGAAGGSSSDGYLGGCDFLARLAHGGERRPPCHP